MKLSLPVIFAKKSTDPDVLKEAEIARLRDPDSEAAEAAYEQYVSNLVIDHLDIVSFYEKEELTVIATAHDDRFTVAIPFESFQKLWMHVSGENILEVKTMLKEMEDNGDEDEII